MLAIVSASLVCTVGQACEIKASLSKTHLQGVAHNNNLLVGSIIAATILKDQTNIALELLRGAVLPLVQLDLNAAEVHRLRDDSQVVLEALQIYRLVEGPSPLQKPQELKGSQ